MAPAHRRIGRYAAIYHLHCLLKASFALSLSLSLSLRGKKWLWASDRWKCTQAHSCVFLPRFSRTRAIHHRVTVSYEKKSYGCRWLMLQCSRSPWGVWVQLMGPVTGLDTAQQALKPDDKLPVPCACSQHAHFGSVNPHHKGWGSCGLWWPSRWAVPHMAEYSQTKAIKRHGVGWAVLPQRILIGNSSPPRCLWLSLPGALNQSGNQEPF